jgi:hypothetical protein
MNVVSANRVEFETLRSLAFGGIGAGFAGVGTRIDNPVRLFKITNLTDAPLFVSFNGVDDQDIVPTYGYFLYDFGSNKSDQSGYLELAAQKRVYVRHMGVAPTLGSVYVTTVYVSQV